MIEDDFTIGCDTMVIGVVIGGVVVTGVAVVVGVAVVDFGNSLLPVKGGLCVVEVEMGDVIDDEERNMDGIDTFFCPYSKLLPLLLLLLLLTF